MKNKPLILCIMDGFAITKETHGNAIYHAKKPNLDKLFSKYPMTLLDASGESVGLPDGQIGNSEVGHMNIGAGRVVYQSLTYLNKKMKEGDFELNAAFSNVFNYCKTNDKPLHLIGLVSKGGVHSHQDHLFKLLELAKKNNVKNTYIHVILDGRDVEPKSGKEDIELLLKEIKRLNYGHIATISGRYFAMDRDKNFSRLEVAYRVMTSLDGKNFKDPLFYLENEYKIQSDEGKVASDEFITPAFNENLKATINDGDGVIFTNFRPDRAIQLATVLTNPYFYKSFNYEPSKILNDIYLVTMMFYAVNVKARAVAYALEEIINPLGVYLETLGLKQLRIAETEKYAHVTFFFDGMINYDGIANPELEGSKRILIPSKKVNTYDLLPEMSAKEITRELLKQLDKNYYDVVILNLANCDMVGHTAVFESVVKAVETVDKCVGQIYDYVQTNGGLLILASDHGNADRVLDENNMPVTAHTTNPVPLVICNNEYEFINERGKLANIAPTMLKLIEKEVPKEMSASPLVRKTKEVIKTPRLELRYFEHTDLKDFNEYCMQENVGIKAGWKRHKNIEESKEILNKFVYDKETYALYLKSENKVIGSIDLCSVGLNEGLIGYVLNENYWNKGLMSEALQYLVTYGFEKAGLDAILVAHHEENDASRRVIEKNGFAYVNREVDNIVLLDEIRIKLNYRLTKEDYLKK